MKLIFGQFLDQQTRQIMQVWEDARVRGISTMIIPYYGETPVQMIDTNRCVKPRKWISLHAHKV